MKITEMVILKLYGNELDKGRRACLVGPDNSTLLTQL